MKYTKVPEPHRSLLFRLVEIHREHGETSSGLIPFQSYGPAGTLVLYSNTVLERYTSSNLHVLEKHGYLDIQPWRIDSVSSFSLRQEAFDYYKYMYSSALWRFIIDVWDKTEKYWLALLFGLIGGALPELAGLVGRLIRWLGSLLR